MCNWHRIEGTPFEAGRELGRLGRTAVERHILPSEMWQQVSALAQGGLAARLADNTAALFPEIMREIYGLAEGLRLPLANVFAWQCRGELLGAVSEGCTTLIIPGTLPCIAHNEDGPPPLRDQCFMVEYVPTENREGFCAFCYPGIIPGTAFGWSASGLVQAVDNLRLCGISPEIPRVVVARATLVQRSVEPAIRVLRNAPSSAGFHFSLGDLCGRIVSVEFGGGRLSTRKVSKPTTHTNHMLCPDEMGIPEIVTTSSSDRLNRASALLEQHAACPLTVLKDTGGSGLPIFRTDPSDPDEENTICSAILRIRENGIEPSIYFVPNDPSIYTETETGAH